MVKNEYVLEILKLRRDSVAEIAQKPERHAEQRSFVKDRRIMTIPFEFGSDHHHGIKEFWIIRSEGR
jgi:hypothetical protein